MIPCHDLRTGNIVLVNNRLRKVTMISNSQTMTDQSVVGVESITYNEVETYPAQDIHPVPMSEAILQQCHFSYRAHYKFWQLVSTEGERNEMDIDADYNLIDFMRRPIVKKISSLHQLQNLHYMLFDKELDFDADTTAPVTSAVENNVRSN